MTLPTKDTRDILVKLDDFDGLLHSRQQDVIGEAHDEIKRLRNLLRRLVAACDEPSFHEVPLHVLDVVADAEHYLNQIPRS